MERAKGKKWIKGQVSLQPMTLKEAPLLAVLSDRAEQGR